MIINYTEQEKERFYSTGDTHQPDERSDFELDRSRIIHSTAFRRLQGKTQVFGLGGSDFFRTRLTHSLEASQIAKGIALRTGANTDLVEAASLAHDIGHPPFGHAAERKLQEMMKDSGGFEGNAQNLRLIHFLEMKHPQGGLNLTRATLDAITKYKILYKDAKNKEIKKFMYDDQEKVIEWISEGGPKNTKSFECEIITWADDIAYSTHDLEDGIKSGLITIESINKVADNVKCEVSKEYEWNEDLWDAVTKIISEPSKLSTEKERKLARKKIISQTIHELMQGAKAIKRNNGKFSPRYEYELEIEKNTKQKCKMLKNLVWEAVITNERIATLSRKAELVVESLFKEFTKSKSENMLPPDFQEMFEKTKTKEEKNRVVCDYIAGMTDNYALKIYGRLFSHDVASVFDLI